MDAGVLIKRLLRVLRVDVVVIHRNMDRIGEERGLRMVQSFHPDLVLGVATYARELFQGAPPLDTVYVPVVGNVMSIVPPVWPVYM